jgi:nicotinamidase-related amidase
VPLDLTDLLSGRLRPGIQSQSDGPVVALLTMEMQRGVMGDLASFPELAAAAVERNIVATTRGLLGAFRSAGKPIVHCVAQFRADRAGTWTNTPLHSAVLRGTGHLLEGTPATQLIPELDVEITDYVSARRHGVAPFTGTPLHETLQSLGVEVVVVAGVSLNLGIPGLCVEAVNLGYSVVVATDAVVGVPLDYGDLVLATTVSLVASLASTDDVVEALAHLTRG